MNDIEEGRGQLTPGELLLQSKKAESKAMDAWDTDPRESHRELMAASDLALRAAKAYPNTADNSEAVSDAAVKGLRLLGLDGNEELVVEKGAEVLGYFRGRLTEYAEDEINGMVEFSQHKLAS